jgi:hypothetical protein
VLGARRVMQATAEDDWLGALHPRRGGQRVGHETGKREHTEAAADTAERFTTGHWWLSAMRHGQLTKMNSFELKRIFR